METNEYLQHLANVASEMAKNVDMVKNPMRGFNPHRQLHRYEQYVLDCLLAMSEIEGLVRQLNASAILMANYRESKKLKEQKISRYDYIIYHIEGHLLRVTSVIDRLLIFVNKVLEMGLTDFKCKIIFMLEDQKNKKGKYALYVEKLPGLYDNLMTLVKYIDIFREDRNIIAHSKEIAYQDLRPIQGYHLILQGPTDSNLTKYKSLIKTKTDKKVKQYKNEMLLFNKKISDLLYPIYKILTAEFDQRYQNYSQL
ncbi:Cthe_2314 family HEPN domain-containing protein [Mucilaginibacter segetis]|uniref:Cthe-2314-like HEPN domain-containing protein n=1 Tax=Mucilaginibacter segetis TaxID=2793071 RepID=A0A934UMK1_9SPHI|nr:Cthe_2314 family HEPN domain-containing protein [Mucilaginibacter segetis]MBK0379733.1 hypothetical protein [Mucilaginibacter segetis]